LLDTLKFFTMERRFDEAILRYVEEGRQKMGGLSLTWEEVSKEDV